MKFLKLFLYHLKLHRELFKGKHSLRKDIISAFEWTKREYKIISK